MKFYDLFSGIGGFRLGLERNGFQCIGSCEIDKYARQVYENRFGETPYSDARELDASSLKFDILTAGFPCQAFSYAGQRLGFADQRGTLFLEIARIAQQARPQLLLLENVKGLLNHDEGRTFGTILNTLYELGYDVEWQVINGKYFVPQNRERIFIIGHLRDKPFKQIFPIGQINQINGGTYEETQTEGQRVRSSSDNTRSIDTRYGCAGVSSRTHVRTIDANYWKGKQSRTMIFMAHTKGNIRQRIQDRDETWNLDTSGTKMGLVLKEQDKIRKLTPLECERLMGFPDNWTAVDGISDTQRYKLIGNSVIVSIIEYIGQHLQSL